MQVITAMRRGANWHVSIRAGAPTQAHDDSARLGEAIERGRRIIGDWYRRLGSDAGVWQLEFPKAALGEGEVAIGYAEIVGDACANGHLDAFEIAAPNGWLSVRSTRRALRARGCRTPGWSVLSAVKDAVSFLAAFALAFPALLIAMIRHGSDEPVPVGSGYLLAVHGEWSNRTRHALSLLTTGDDPDAILVLGRPTASMAGLQGEWQEKLGRSLPPLRRPFSLRSALRSMPGAWRCALQGMRIAAAAPYLPPMRERMAMAWRSLLGEASATWWRNQVRQGGAIVYGHTGTADTTGLELAQQAGGARTLHMVHGVSAGLNFIARSSDGLFRCGHDAQWHRSLGGYRNCRADVAEQPQLVPGGQGLLLLTNYAHPMNPWFRASGLKSEIDALETVADAASRAGQASVEKRWKPHPAIVRLPQEQQAALRRRAAELGFLELGQDCNPVAEARNSRWVVCTMSTVIIELLAGGVLPVMLRSPASDPDSALATYPLCESDADSLAATLAQLDHANERGRLFKSAWSSIRPARPWDYSFVIAD